MTFSSSPIHTLCSSFWRSSISMPIIYGHYASMLVLLVVVPSLSLYFACVFGWLKWLFFVRFLSLSLKTYKTMYLFYSLLSLSSLFFPSMMHLSPSSSTSPTKLPNSITNQKPSLLLSFFPFFSMDICTLRMTAAMPCHASPSLFFFYFIFWLVLIPRWYIALLLTKHIKNRYIKYYIIFLYSTHILIYKQTFFSIWNPFAIHFFSLEESYFFTYLYPILWRNTRARRQRQCFFFFSHLIFFTLKSCRVFWAYFLHTVKNRDAEAMFLRLLQLIFWCFLLLPLWWNSGSKAILTSHNNHNTYSCFSVVLDEKNIKRRRRRRQRSKEEKKISKKNFDE